jgi:site-specific recombinase XerD
MDTLLNFKESLMTGANPCSPVTAKNYIADVKNFIEWYQKTSSKSFNPADISLATIEHYKKSTTLSASTIERHLSSLRKYFNFLATTHQLPNPFTATPIKNEVKDPWNIRGFKNFLYKYNASNLTIKNYSIDIMQYLRWLEEVASTKDAYALKDKNIYNYITAETIEEYKFRLHAIAKLSPASINRKLSSLRRYAAWAVEEGLLTKEALITIPNIPDELQETQQSYNLNIQQDTSNNINTEELQLDTIPDVLEEKSKTYSSFPPLRLLQKTANAGLWIFDAAITSPIIKLLEQAEYTKWSLTGRNIFTVTKIAMDSGKEKVKRKASRPLEFLTPNFKKSFYAPLSISTRWLPIHKKLFHHIKHTRPKWYRIYHSYALVHYAHLGLLILAVSLSSYIAYDSFTTTKENARSVLAGSDYTKLLNYKGRLTDNNGSPIIEPTSVKFALYNDPKKKGSALIWQEIHTITPDKNGNFIVSLGQLSPLSQNVFLQNEKIYLGIKVGINPELQPRQQIPTTSYATTSESIQGLRPITDPGSGTKNAILALDSLGNLTIGGSANPIFQATGGIFTLSGSTLLLSTTPGTNTDVIIAPDGIGKIDLQKPLHNSTEDINGGILSGVVTIEDSLAVIATSSGQSALYINQNGTAPLISGNSNGTAKFVLESSGNLGIGTTSPAESILQVADGNDGYGATITAKDGGAILMASNGTPPLIIGNNTDGKGEINLRIFPNGEIDYNNSKTAEPKITLPSSKALFVSGGKGITIAGQITPATDSFYNLGSENLKWNKIYVNEIITNGINGTFGFMQLKDGVVAPSNITNDFIIGGNSTSSAKFQVYSSGSNAGSIMMTGHLSFSGASPKLVISTTDRFDIQTLGPADTLPTSKLTISGVGNIGIGTTTPLHRLDLVDNQNATVSALISNTSLSANAGVLALKLGTSSPVDNNSYITFLNGSGKAVGAITGNTTTGGVSYQSWGSDFAEYFKKTNPYEVLFPGDIVCLNSTGTVSKCAELATNIVGVVSNQAGFIGNAKHQNDPNYVLIGLIGQLPVTFSTENGEIAPGDPLMIGKDGKAVKATLPGQILGRALQGSRQATEEKINVYVSLSWHDPKAQLSASGTLDTPTYNSIRENKEVTSPTLKLNVLLVKGKEIVSESVETSLLSAADITTNSLTVAGKNLNEYVLEKIAENLQRINTQELNSPVASINSIRTDIISPLSYDSEIALNFRKQVVQIENTKTKKIVAQIDSDGNAQFAGNVEATSLTAQNASIAGTLRTGNLIADDIELSDKALAKLKSSSPSATYISNITNIYQSTTSANKIAVTTPSPDTPGTLDAPDTLSDTPGTLDAPDTLSYTPASSLSGTLTYAPDLKAKFGTFEQGLMSLGITSTADLAVAGQLSINGSFVIADNTINVLGQDLELQPLRQGSLSIMAGKVKIDTDGNLEVEGNAHFAKNIKVNDTLFTKIISPLAESDLIVKLNKKKDAQGSSFVIQDASGSARFSVNDLGEIIASGGGKFKEVIAENINVVRSAQADTSLTETVASASAGTAIINKFQKERTIFSPYVKADSLIYISPLSDTAGLTPYIARQTIEDREKNSRGSFTIQVSKPTTKDIKVNWWIIN